MGPHGAQLGPRACEGVVRVLVPAWAQGEEAWQATCTGAVRATRGVQSGFDWTQGCGAPTHSGWGGVLLVVQCSGEHALSCMVAGWQETLPRLVLEVWMHQRAEGFQ